MKGGEKHLPETKKNIELTIEQKKELQLKAYMDYFEKRLEFNSFSKQIIQDLVNNKKESVIFKQYKKEEIIDALANPQSNEKKIRDMSIFLYTNSSHYRRLCNYFSKLCTYNYSIIPYNVNSNSYNKNIFFSNYRKVATLLEKFNFKHKLQTIFNICMYQDVYCGLFYETSESFDIVQINPDYCKISYKEDSTLVFSLNFDFFKTREYLLDSYGEEIKQMYESYVGYLPEGKKKRINGDLKKQWQEPPKQICLKVNEDQLLFSLPPFSGIFPEILNLEEYKLLKKSGEILARYKLLVMNIPLNESGEMQFDEGLAEKYYNHACKNIDTGVGLVLSPMKIDSIDFHKNATAESDAVNEAENALWSATGSNGALFGLGDKLSSSSLGMSIKNDETIMFAMLRQVENWISKYLKQLNLPYDFMVKFLNQTYYNENEVCDKYQKAATFGVMGAKTLYQASLGISSSDAMGFDILENVLDYNNKWTPLQSSNTQSNGESGRPQQTKVDDSGESTREGDSNVER